MGRNEHRDQCMETNNCCLGEMFQKENPLFFSQVSQFASDGNFKAAFAKHVIKKNCSWQKNLKFDKQGVCVWGGWLLFIKSTLQPKSLRHFQLQFSMLILCRPFLCLQTRKRRKKLESGSAMWMFLGRPKTQIWLFCAKAFSGKEPCHSSTVSPRNFPEDLNFTSYFKWKSWGLGQISCPK